VIDAVKSEAVRIYTSWRRTPMPTVDPDGVRGMSVPNPAALLAYAKGLVDDMFAVYPLDWYGDGDLGEAMKAVEAGMAANHPELDAEAVKALAWMWGYSAWK
jgi:hypothetical protein